MAPYEHQETKKGADPRLRAFWSASLSSPQDYVEDVYLSVRLEAGTLHLANYLIHTTFYYLATKVTIII